MAKKKFLSLSYVFVVEPLRSKFHLRMCFDHIDGVVG